MLLMSFYVDCAYRAGRADILAGSASDALAFIHYRELRSVLVFRVNCNH